jgi:hypothetical protein
MSKADPASELAKACEELGRWLGIPSITASASAYGHDLEELRRPAETTRPSVMRVWERRV